MKKYIFALLCLLIFPIAGHAATRYVTSVACTGNYSVANNNCSGTGSGLNSYTSIASVLANDAAGDIIRFRTGTYNAPSAGIWPLANQIWEGCRAAVCGTDETATINGATATGADYVIFWDTGVDGGANITFRDLTFSTSPRTFIGTSGTSGAVLERLNVSGWNTSAVDYWHGIQLGTGSGVTTDFIIRNCTVHDTSTTAVENGGITVGWNSSNGLIENNTLSNVRDGIWFDVQSGAPNRGYTPHTVRGNTVTNASRICYHIEDESAWFFNNNIANGCSEGLRARPGNPIMQGHRYYNNTFYNTTVAVWITNDPGTENYTDSQFKNNIFLNNSSSRPTIVFSDDYQTDTTNLFANNLVRNLNASGAGAVCWGGAGPGFDPSNCNSPGVEYTNAQMSTWNGSASADNNLSAVPLFANAAGGDFRLCTAAGVPAAGCSGASPGIDQGVDVGLAYNGSAPDLGALETSVGGTSGLPYPASTVITNMTLNWGSHIELAPGSDNWPMTWADDGHQYTSWGDGGGFGGTNNNGRVSLGFGRVEGTDASYSGINVWGGQSPEHPATFEGKTYGIISIGGVLYSWVTPGSNTEGYAEARIYTSTNHAASWSAASWAFTLANNIITPTWLQAGQNYGSAPDGYLYTYAIVPKDTSTLKVQIPGQLVLMRVPVGSITTQGSYEFFAGMSGSTPTWTSNVASKVPVFSDANGVGWNVSALYHPGLQRYFLMTEHTVTSSGHFGVFEGPTPWGPWATVLYHTAASVFGNGTHGGNSFFWNLAPKWLSGNDFTLVWSGINNDDSWNSVRGAFTVTVDTIEPPTNLRVVSP